MSSSKIRRSPLFFSIYSFAYLLETFEALIWLEYPVLSGDSMLPLSLDSDTDDSRLSASSLESSLFFLMFCICSLLLFLRRSSISRSFAACCFACASLACLYSLTTQINLISLMTRMTRVIRPARDVLAIERRPVVWSNSASMIHPMSAIKDIVETTSKTKKKDNQ